MSDLKSMPASGFRVTADCTLAKASRRPLRCAAISSTEPLDSAVRWVIDLTTASVLRTRCWSSARSVRSFPSLSRSADSAFTVLVTSTNVITAPAMKLSMLR